MLGSVRGHGRPTVFITRKGLNYSANKLNGRARVEAPPSGRDYSIRSMGGLV